MPALDELSDVVEAAAVETSELIATRNDKLAKDLSPTKFILLHRLLRDAPRDVCVSALCEYLSLRDIARLDTALLERSVRDVFLDFLSTNALLKLPDPILREGESNGENEVRLDALLWLVRRRLTIDRFAPAPLRVPSALLSLSSKSLDRSSGPASPAERPSVSRSFFSQSHETATKSSPPPSAGRARHRSQSCGSTAAALIASVVELSPRPRVASPSPATTRSRSLSLSLEDSLFPTQSLRERVVHSVQPTAAELWDEILSKRNEAALRKVLSRSTALALDSLALSLSDTHAARLLELLHSPACGGDKTPLGGCGCVCNLTEITLRGFKKLDGYEIVRLVRGCVRPLLDEREASSHNSARCRGGLTRLDVSGYWRVSDCLLREVSLTHAHTLRVLDVSACFALSSDALCDVLTRCVALTELRANYCVAVNDRVMEVLCSHCTRVERTSFVGCVGLTDACAESIARHGRALKTLELCGVPALSDDFLVTLSFARSADCSLESLVLEGCAGITTQGVIAFVSRCVGLKRVCVRSCANVESSELIKAVGDMLLRVQISVSS